jgi:hypothetical protein
VAFKDVKLCPTDLLFFFLFIFVAFSLAKISSCFAITISSLSIIGAAASNTGEELVNPRGEELVKSIEEELVNPRGEELVKSIEEELDNPKGEEELR